MAIEVRTRGGKTTFRVRYFDEEGQRRSKEFSPRKLGGTRKARSAAALFDAQWKADRRSVPSRGREAKERAINELVLEDIWEGFLLDYSLNKMESSLRPRREGWQAHIHPHLGGYRLDEITPAVVVGWRDARLKAGAGKVALARAMETLKLMLDYAVLMGYVDYNAAAGVARPSRKRQKTTIIVSPDILEQMRGDAADRGWRQTAFIIGLLYGTGLRPQELQGLTLGHLREQSGNARLLIDRRVSSRTIVPGTKSGVPYRFVPLHPRLAADIHAWAEGLGLNEEDALLKAMRAPFWTSAVFANWRVKYWHPLAAKYHLADDDPYALRHTAASLWLRELPPAEVAQALGHSIEVLFSVYGHVIDDLRGDRRPWPTILTEARLSAGTDALFGAPIVLGELAPPKPRSRRVLTTP